MAIIKVSCLFLVILILGGIGFLTLQETYSYLNRSEATARPDATAIFLKACKDLEVDPKTFKGPVRPYPADDEISRQYHFEWSRGPGEFINVGVTYWPYNIEASPSPRLIEQSWEKKLKRKAPHKVVAPHT